MADCARCYAAIRWAKTPKGKAIPIDAMPPEDGRANVVLSRDLLGELLATTVKPGEGTHVSHFATCPYAAEFRRKP